MPDDKKYEGMSADELKKICFDRDKTIAGLDHENSELENTNTQLEKEVEELENKISDLEEGL